MVTIFEKGDNFIFEVKGLHKLWAFKSELSIPKEHVRKAYQNEKHFGFFEGFRLPGTQFPGLIKAGTYFAKDGTLFCDVVDKKKSIVVELSHEFYDNLIIEVEDPTAAIEMLNKVEKQK